MSDLRDLYQETILEHSKSPRNYRKLEAANRTAEGYNPLCGDHFTLYVDVQGDAIRDIGFQGSGCAISKASASMMTQSVKGRSKAEAQELFRRFHELVTNQAPVNATPSVASSNGPSGDAMRSKYTGVFMWPFSIDA